jgi:hypothetical protein
MTPETAPRPPEPLTSARLLLAVVPLFALAAGGGLWLWAAHGPGAYLDMALAFVAGCF